MEQEPKTLQQAVVYFANPVNCRNYLVARRWPNGVTCPQCGSDKVAFSEKHNRWQCSARHPRRQFTSKTGTVMEDSPISLDKWLMAIWLLTSGKIGISYNEISRDLGVTQKSAWHMMHRIRLAMQDDLTGGLLGGEIEVDETYIGGKARNMHRSRRIKADVQGSSKGKTIVLGILQRQGKVRATVIPDRTKKVMQENIRPHVEPGSHVFSGEPGAYWKMEGFNHGIVNHTESYVKGNVHTNGLENFWSLLKRGIGGTYVSVEPFHLFRYIDEQAYRFNNRTLDDAERFSMGRYWDCWETYHLG